MEMIVLIVAYVASIASLVLFLLCQDWAKENADVHRHLADMERRAVRAETELSALDARDRLCEILPYRGDLHAAHARIVGLEQENRRLAKWQDMTLANAEVVLTTGERIPLLPPGSQSELMDTVPEAAKLF